MSFTIPDRAGDMTGDQFAGSVLTNTGAVREKAVLQQAALGNVPPFMREAVDVTIEEGGHSLTVSVLPDYFCIGNDENFLRMPMFPGTAQKIATLFNATLPTRKLVNEIWKAASLHLSPWPLSPSSHMISTEAFSTHNRIIEKQRGGHRGLLAGHKKDIVLTPLLSKVPGHIAIYGWHYPTGIAVQGLNATSHSDTYVDYSHGVRLVCQDILLDGAPGKLQDLLQDKALCGLVSDEGISSFLMYPTG